MRTLNQINEDIDNLLGEAEQLRQREHELDAAATIEELREHLHATRRANDAKMMLTRQERWEHNVLRNLAAESEALFDAKLRHTAAYDAYGEAVREHKAHEYSDVGTRTQTRRAMEDAHSDLCEAALHLSNVQAVFACTKESAAHCTATGRALRSAGHITRALAA